MNLKQKLVVWLGLLLFGGMGVYPPWVQSFRYPSENLSFPERSQGYSWIWEPPSAPEWIYKKYQELGQGDRKLSAFEVAVGFSEFWATRIDHSRLLVQWAVVVAAVFGLACTLRTKQTAAESMMSGPTSSDSWFVEFAQEILASVRQHDEQGQRQADSDPIESVPPEPPGRSVSGRPQSVEEASGSPVDERTGPR